MTNDPNAIVFNGAGQPLEEKNYEIPDVINDDEAIVAVSYTHLRAHET